MSYVTKKTIFVCITVLLTLLSFGCSEEEHINCVTAANFENYTIYNQYDLPDGSKSSESPNLSTSEVAVQYSLEESCRLLEEMRCEKECDNDNKCITDCKNLDKNNRDRIQECKKSITLVAASCRDDWGDGKEFYSFGGANDVSNLKDHSDGFEVVDHALQ